MDYSKLTDDEINVLVAEGVMGWDGVPERHDGIHTAIRYRWSPSTNIAHAWEVVEKMMEVSPFWGPDCLWCERFNMAPTDPKGWMANFGDDRTRAFADTFCRAICEAALRAAEDK